jgi:hypothetical protein
LTQPSALAKKPNERLNIARIRDRLETDRALFEAGRCGYMCLLSWPIIVASEFELLPRIARDSFRAMAAKRTGN